MYCEERKGPILGVFFPLSPVIPRTSSYVRYHYPNFIKKNIYKEGMGFKIINNGFSIWAQVPWPHRLLSFYYSMEPDFKLLKFIFCICSSLLPTSPLTEGYCEHFVNKQIHINSKFDRILIEVFGQFLQYILNMIIARENKMFFQNVSNNSY